MTLLVFFIIHWYASFFLQSFFYHRYTAHRHFYMSRRTEKCFYILCFIVHGSSYMSPRTYGILHRLHHMHSDTAHDPHSPHFHKGFWRTLWQTRNSYHAVHTGQSRIEEKLTKDLPEWSSFEGFAHNWATRLAWIALYGAFYAWFASEWWMFLLLPFTIILCSFQGALINWWAHTAGYENYPAGDSSKNILPVDFLFIGDAYHNNHHKYPGRAKNAHRWFEIDPIYHVTCILHKMRIVTWKHQL